MSQEYAVSQKRVSDSPRAKNQQRQRRRKSLLKKAYEYGVECDADVYLALRIRKDGRIFTFNTDSSGQWLSSLQELDNYYPRPVQKTIQDIAEELGIRKYPSAMGISQENREGTTEPAL